jgi:hypothetical protein
VWIKACHEIQGMGGTKAVVVEAAEKFRLEPRDFLRNVQHLCALFTAVLKSDGVCFGLIE